LFLKGVWSKQGRLGAILIGFSSASTPSGIMDDIELMLGEFRPFTVNEDAALQQIT
jgi:hypothetical protein